MGSAERFDALIVGGGPAGAVAAIALASRGWRVLLVEKGARNRSKPCGDCVSADALILLEAPPLGLHTVVRRLATGTNRRICIRTLGRGPVVRAHFDTQEQGIVVPRAELDQCLRDAAASAGACVLHHATCTLAGRSDDGVLALVRTAAATIRVRTPLVIGADGVGSGVARAAGLATRESAGRKFGFSFDRNCAHDAIEHGVINMLIHREGYLGVVVQNDGRLHGAALVRSAAAGAARRDRSPARILGSMASTDPQLRAAGLHEVGTASPLALAAIGPLPWRPRAVAGSGVALVGDAAGYVEPFTGQGIAWAIRSALLLGRTLDHARPGTWTTDLARAYAEAWRRDMAPRHRWCCALAAALERPRLCSLAMIAGSRLPSISRAVARRAVRA